MRKKCDRRLVAAIFLCFGGLVAICAPVSAAILREVPPDSQRPARPDVAVTDSALGLPTDQNATLPAEFDTRFPRAAALTPAESTSPGPSDPASTAQPVSDAPTDSASTNPLRSTISPPNETGEIYIGPAPQTFDVAPPVPEPSSVLLLCAAGLCAAVRRGRRR